MSQTQSESTERSWCHRHTFIIQAIMSNFSYFIRPEGLWRKPETVQVHLMTSHNHDPIRRIACTESTCVCVRISLMTKTNILFWWKWVCVTTLTGEADVQTESEWTQHDVQHVYLGNKRNWWMLKKGIGLFETTNGGKVVSSIRMWGVNCHLQWRARTSDERPAMTRL